MKKRKEKRKRRGEKKLYRKLRKNLEILRSTRTSAKINQLKPSPMLRLITIHQWFNLMVMD
jgi:hypothetical protein